MASAVVAAALALGAAVLGFGTAPAAAGPLDTPGYTKAFTCSACHGPAGQSVSTAMPIIAGMDRGYFKKAIEDYAAGRRPSPEMEPYAKMVRELGADEIAGYFASQRFQPTTVKPEMGSVERGKAAAGQCVQCHGPGGKGDPAKLVPNIAGQAPGYMRTQLLLFKADKRNPNDEALKALKAIIKPIPDETLADLAAYYSTLK